MLVGEIDGNRSHEDDSNQQSDFRTIDRAVIYDLLDHIEEGIGGETLDLSSRKLKHLYCVSLFDDVTRCCARRYFRISTVSTLSSLRMVYHQILSEPLGRCSSRQSGA